MIERAALYVDGFNIYHAIDALARPHLKWLNLKRVGELIIPQRTQRLDRVVYCTAWYPGDQQKRWRHQQYLNALAAVGVECQFGHYVHEDMSCKNCSHVWRKPTEKETDINLAVSLINDAWLDIYDHAYLITADSDQAATARLFQKQFPNKKRTTVAPPGRNFSVHILNFAHGKITLTEEILERCLFESVVINPAGNGGHRPKEYEPPIGWIAPHLRPSKKSKT